MIDPPTFRRGDEVGHSKRPEWGVGKVDHAHSVTHQGRPAQRLTVTFQHRGRITLNTAVAPITPRETESKMRSTEPTPSANGGWLASLEGDTGDELGQMPHAATDLFSSLEQRFDATLETFRFSTEPRALIEWATAQTGLEDPLTRYTRHELEEGFQRFEHNRKKHLKELVGELRREAKSDVVNAAVRNARHPGVADAVRRAARG